MQVKLPFFATFALTLSEVLPCVSVADQFRNVDGVAFRGADVAFDYDWLIALEHHIVHVVRGQLHINSGRSMGGGGGLRFGFTGCRSVAPFGAAPDDDGNDYSYGYDNGKCRSCQSFRIQF